MKNKKGERERERASAQICAMFANATKFNLRKIKSHNMNKKEMRAEEKIKHNIMMK